VCERIYETKVEIQHCASQMKYALCCILAGPPESLQLVVTMSEAPVVRKNHYNLATKLECIFALGKSLIETQTRREKSNQQKLLAITASLIGTVFAQPNIGLVVNTAGLYTTFVFAQWWPIEAASCPRAQTL